jgi:hypothetical protein
VGAWGNGPFENDDAADLVGEIESSGLDLTGLEDRLGENYLEVDTASMAIALVEIALAALGHRKPSDALAGLDLEGLALSPDDLDVIIAAAQRALNQDGSELFELWAERGEEELHAWRAPALESLAELEAVRSAL